MNIVAVRSDNIFGYNLKVKTFDKAINDLECTYESSEWGEYRKTFNSNEWKKIAFYNLVLFKYYSFHVQPLTRFRESDMFNKYRNFLKSKYGNCMYYKPISNYFFFNYTAIYDNYHLLKHRKNQLIFDNGIHIIESLLYSNMIENDYGKNKYYVYNINTTNHSSIKENSTMMNDLKKRYNKEKVYYDNNDETIINNYEKIIKKYKNRKISAIYINYYNNDKNISRKHIIMTFVILTIAFNVLIKDGIFIFRDKELPPLFLSQILHICSKYFNKIYCEKKIGGGGEVGGLYICDGYSGSIDKEDEELFKKIIEEWNKIEPEDGDKINEYVSSIISYHVISYIDIHINNRYKEKETKYLKKIQHFDMLFGDINNITDDIIIEYNKSMNIINNHYIVGMAHKYNIPIKDRCIIKFNERNNPVTDVLKYQNSIIYGITMKTESNNKKKVDLNYLVTRINMYRFGLKSTNKNKWKNIINKLSISSYLLSTLPYKNSLFFAELTEINNFLIKYKYNSISYIGYLKHKSDDYDVYLPYEINDDKYDIAIAKNMDNIDFINKINTNGSLIYRLKMPNNDKHMLSIIYYLSLIFNNIFFMRPSITTLDSLYVYIMCIKKKDNKTYNNDLEIPEKFELQYYNICNAFTDLFIEKIKAIYYGIDNESYIRSIEKNIEQSQYEFAETWLNINK